MLDLKTFKKLVDHVTSIEHEVVERINMMPYQALFERVASMLGSGPEMVKKFDAIRHELARRHTAFDEQLKPYVGFADSLRECFRQEEVARDAHESDWIAALSLIWVHGSHLHGMTKDDVSLQMSYANDYAIGRAIKYLKAEGIQVQINGDDIDTDEKNEDALTEKIDGLARLIGGADIINLMLKDLNEVARYDSDMGQFLIGRRFNQYGGADGPQVPWGFIFNLGIKHILSTPRFTNESAYRKLKEITIHALCIMELQPYSHWEEPFIDTDELLLYMQRSVVYDSVFTITQMKAQHAQQMYSGLWSNEEKNSITVDGLQLQSLISLMDGVLAAAKIDQLETIDLKRMSETLRCGKDRLERWLDMISHVDSPNPEFRFPPRATKINYREKPLIRLKKGIYLVLPRPMLAPLLAEFSVEFCAKARKSVRDSIGQSIETLIRTRMAGCGVSNSSGKYDYRKSETDIQMASDCDVVVQSPEHIIFFECKAKQLTRSARSGDDLSLVVDMSKSLIQSQTQAMVHEKLLLSRNTLDLIDERSNVTSLPYKHHRIERVSVSLWGYGSLQSDIFIAKFLRTCFTSTFGSTQVDADRQLRTLESKELRLFRSAGNGLADFTEEGWQRPFLSARFLSVSNMLLLLEFSSDTESFVHKLMRGKSMSNGSRDFVLEFRNQKNLDDYKARSSPVGPL